MSEKSHKEWLKNKQTVNGVRRGVAVEVHVVVVMSGLVLRLRAVTAGNPLTLYRLQHLTRLERRAHSDEEVRSTWGASLSL